MTGRRALPPKSDGRGESGRSGFVRAERGIHARIDDRPSASGRGGLLRLKEIKRVRVNDSNHRIDAYRCAIIARQRAADTAFKFVQERLAGWCGHNVAPVIASRPRR